MLPGPSLRERHQRGELRDAAGNFLARGYANPASLITFRALSRDPSVKAPEQPDAVVETLRRAFDATMADAEFRAEVGRAKAEVEPLKGEEVQKLIVDTVNAPPQVVQRMKDILAVK